MSETANRDRDTDLNGDHPLCRPVPSIDADEIDENAIGFTGSDPASPYARGVYFRYHNRNYELLDQDGDGTVDHAFSFGNGGDAWCCPHAALPAAAIERVEEVLAPLDIEIPGGYRWEEDA